MPLTILENSQKNHQILAHNPCPTSPSNKIYFFCSSNFSIRNDQIRIKKGEEFEMDLYKRKRTKKIKQIKFTEKRVERLAV